eukprot:GFYU01020440.1.p1 GENE.GFYU01020440.1~~GFYU01020440.1.p1  ORF type:complete len:333 (+),score=94.56 GFYU01020440.1:158-1156(+)
MADPSKDKVNKNVNQLSKKLLEGWTLLSDSCPNTTCNVPLIMNKAKEIYCINCDKYCERDGDSMKYSLNQPTTGQTPAPAQAPAPVATAPASVVAPPAVSSSPKKQNDSGSRSDSSSALIAQKLLQGWTLLNDYCPNPDCSVPLVRNKEGQMSCVSCGNRVIKEEDFDPSRHKVIGDIATLSSGVTADSAAGIPKSFHEDKRRKVDSPPLKPSTAPVTGAKLELSHLSGGDTVAKAAPASSLYAASPNKVVDRSALYGSITDPSPSLSTSQPGAPGGGHSTIVHNTIEALYMKLESSRRSLISAKTIDDSKAVASLINECASAIQTLSTLSK